MGERSDEERRVEVRGGGGLLKHTGIQASQKREINGVCVSVTVALCAKRPLVKPPPHIWHERRAWGDNHLSLSLFLWRKEIPLGTTIPFWLFL